MKNFLLSFIAFAISSMLLGQALKMSNLAKPPAEKK